MRFTISFPGPLETPATVAGTALEGSDFVATAGSRTFAPGELRAAFWLPIVGDAVAEPSASRVYAGYPHLMRAIYMALL